MYYNFLIRSNQLIFMRFDPNEAQLDHYLKFASTPVADYLRALERETWLKIPAAHMLTGFAQGRLLSLISILLRPNRILEIGTFTGYGALCLAEGLSPEGKLITLESSSENAWLARKYFEISPFSHQIELKMGVALASLTDLKETWDLIYIDADKINNRRYFDTCWPHVRHGGIVLIDNVLANGNVFKTTEDQKPYERAVSELNAFLPGLKDARVLMLPIRDGLTLIQKIT